jgi:hypothetical protein
MKRAVGSCAGRYRTVQGFSLTRLDEEAVSWERFGEDGRVSRDGYVLYDTVRGIWWIRNDVSGGLSKESRL